MLVLPMQVIAAGGTHTVVPGDTMWKIAVRYQIGYSELLKANPQIAIPC
jgi:LysM repeat protein